MRPFLTNRRKVASWSLELPTYQDGVGSSDLLFNTPSWTARNPRVIEAGARFCRPEANQQLSVVALRPNYSFRNHNVIYALFRQNEFCRPFLSLPLTTLSFLFFCEGCQFQNVCEWIRPDCDHQASSTETLVIALGLCVNFEIQNGTSNLSTSCQRLSLTLDAELTRRTEVLLSF